MAPQMVDHDAEAAASGTQKAVRKMQSTPSPDREEGALGQTSFQSFAAEGDILAKQGDFRKAIEAYTKALNLKPLEKNVLVARSKCFLQLGDSESALNDANMSLKADPEFFKGVFQKAEALYAKGDFEMALVFYHRGHNFRPEQDEFRLGIQKAREAIDNSIGNPKDYKFQPPANVRILAGGAVSIVPSTAGGAVGSGNAKHTAVSASGRESVKREVSVHDRTEKQLLGELYSDKEYLESLINDRDFVTNPNTDVVGLVSDALKYLETRTEFWRQQKPIYARRKEHSRILAKSIAERNRQLIEAKALEFSERRSAAKKRMMNPKTGGGWLSENSDVESGTETSRLPKTALGSTRPQSSEPLKAVKAAMNVINRSIERCDYQSAHISATHLLTRLNDMKGLENKDRAVSDVLSTLGNICIELGKLPEAMKFHRKDLAGAKASKLRDCVSRALGNIGRTCVRLGRYEDAITAFEKKLKTSVDVSVDRAWLLHDIGRCHFELVNDVTALEKAEACALISDQLKDRRWGLNARVLIAQVESRNKHFKRAATEYNVSLNYAKELNDSTAIEALKSILNEVKRHLPKLSPGQHSNSAQPPIELSAQNHAKVLVSIAPVESKRVSASLQSAALPAANQLNPARSILALS